MSHHSYDAIETTGSELRSFPSSKTEDSESLFQQSSSDHQPPSFISSSNLESPNFDTLDENKDSRMTKSYLYPALFCIWWILIPLLLLFLIAAVFDPVGRFHMSMAPGQTILLPPAHGQTLRVVTIPQTLFNNQPQKQGLKAYRFQVPPPLYGGDTDPEFYSQVVIEKISWSSITDFQCFDFFLNKMSQMHVSFNFNGQVQVNLDNSHSIPCQYLESYNSEIQSATTQDGTNLPLTSKSGSFLYSEVETSSLTALTLRRINSKTPSELSGVITITLNMTGFNYSSTSPSNNFIDDCDPKNGDCFESISPSSEDSDPSPLIISAGKFKPNVEIGQDEFFDVDFEVLFYQKESIVTGFIVGLVLFIPCWCGSGVYIFMKYKRLSNQVEPLSSQSDPGFYDGHRIDSQFDPLDSSSHQVQDVHHAGSPEDTFVAPSFVLDGS